MKRRDEGVKHDDRFPAMEDQSVEEFAKERLRNLIKCSENFSVSAEISIERYLRLAKSVLSKARFLVRDKNYESALFHSTKLAILLLERLPSHPEYKTCSIEHKKSIKLLVEEILPLAERCKTDTLEKYKKEESERRANLYKSQESLSFENKTTTSTPCHRIQHQSTLESIFKSDEDSSHSSGLSSDIIAKNLSAVSFSSKSLQPSPIVRRESKKSEETNEFYEYLKKDLYPENAGKVLAPTQSLKAAVEKFQDDSQQGCLYPQDQSEKNKIYQRLEKDLIPKREVHYYDEVSQRISSNSKKFDSRECGNEASGRQTFLASEKSDEQPAIRRPVPMFNRELKTNQTPPLSKHVEPEKSYDDLTLIIIPYNIRSTFERCSVQNTMNNIETCGLLVGKLNDDGAYVITHLLIPKQKGTSDGCQMMGEHECMMFQDSHQLLTIGWIHSHPSQTAFLSSVDMHTHFGYQCLLSEAIAYVISHKYDEEGIFNLTDYGFSVINKCKSSGHHYHPDSAELFQRVDHVIIDEKLSVELIDFRN